MIHSNYKVLVFLLSVLSIACEKEKAGLKVEDFFKLGSDLPVFIDESSGLALDSLHYWTHNDSGSDPILYSLDFSFELTSSRFIASVSNNDWEAVCIDSEFLYIGDFGNNDGDRTDLAIHQIPRSDLFENIDTINSATSFSFNYPIQDDFDPRPGNHNFDCEAMLIHGSKMYLFTKNHANKMTDVYQLDPALGDQPAAYLYSFDVGGLITDAAMYPGGDALFLLGYTKSNGNFAPFIWYFYDFEGIDFFDGRKERYELPLNAQTEGLEVTPAFKLVITTEARNGVSGQCYRLDFAPFQ